MPHAVQAWFFARDFGILVAVILGYFFLRGQAPARINASVDVTVVLIDIEKALRVFWEPEIQELSTHFYWTQELANYVYAYMHFPVLAAVGAWLWARDRRQFRIVRDTMYVSMVIGLVFYYAVPAAPPRLMALNGHDYGFVDTVFGGNTTVQYMQPSLFVNQYAAIPSFHFGWMALASVALWASEPHPLARVGAVFLTLIMTWASVATANHLFIDVALGGLVVLGSWLVAVWVRRRMLAAPQ